MVRKRIIELDENDVLLAPEGFGGDPLICWCYTAKFDRSLCLRDSRTGRTLILINLRNLRCRTLRGFDPQLLPFAVGMYIDYVVLHELVHYGDEERKVNERVWDQRVLKLVEEGWSDGAPKRGKT